MGVEVAICGAHFLPSAHGVAAGFGNIDDLFPRPHCSPTVVDIAAVAADLVEGACGLQRRGEGVSDGEKG